MPQAPDPYRSGQSHLREPIPNTSKVLPVTPPDTLRQPPEVEKTTQPPLLPPPLPPAYVNEASSRPVECAQKQQARESGKAHSSVKYFILGGIALFLLMMVFVAIVASSSVAGTYRRTDTYYGGHSYTSTITLKDGSIDAKIRTGYGAVHKSGTYEIDKKDSNKIHVTWASQRFYNVVGPRPSTDEKQTFTCGYDSYARKRYIAIGETYYHRSSSK